MPFADCAHVFRVNNTPVVGDIVDLRKNGNPSTDECQFMSGPPGTTFSVGFRAYHVTGVTSGRGPGDTNSFVRAYTISWQRGLNGPSGTIETGIADQGELAVEPSNTGPAGLERFRCAGETGEMLWMKEPHREGVASRTDPESCAAHPQG